MKIIAMAIEQYIISISAVLQDNIDIYYVA